MDSSGRAPDFEGLEAKIAELESLADDLAAVPDEDLTRVLVRAVELMGEVNAGVESTMRSLNRESREVGELLGRVDFGAFDAALAELEHQGRPAGEPGP